MFYRAGDQLLRLDAIRRIDASRMEDLEVAVEHDLGVSVLRGVEAIDLLMVAKPSALEGKRLRWIRHAWAFHNLVAHPTMQVLAWFGYPALGVRLHDATVPRPSGRRGSHG